LISILLDSFTIARRDLIRSFRQKSHLYGSIVRPVIWLFLLGNGLKGSFTQVPGGYSYTQFIFPGMLTMNVLFASVMTGTSIIWDREFGFLKEIMVAPVSRSSIVIGKTLSGSMTACLQGTIVLALFPLVSLNLSILQIISTILAMFITAMAATSLGIMIASRMTSFEGFGTLNNFIIMPMFFLSGAMYPIEKVPQILKAIIVINPITYSVEMLRGIILKQPANYFSDIFVLIIFILVAFSIANYMFIKERR